VAVRGVLTLNVDTTKVLQLAANNTFTGSQTINNNVTITATGTTLSASGGATGLSGTGSESGVYGYSGSNYGVLGQSSSGDGVLGSSQHLWQQQAQSCNKRPQCIRYSQPWGLDQPKAGHPR
jgi:hypothetical protein